MQWFEIELIHVVEILVIFGCLGIDGEEERGLCRGIMFLFPPLYLSLMLASDSCTIDRNTFKFLSHCIRLYMSSSFMLFLCKDSWQVLFSAPC